MNKFEKALAAELPLVLDGGLATELEASGFNIDGDLWSAALLQTHPAAILAAHRAYLDSGADCIISASYQASRMGFTSQGLSASEADLLILKSVALACTARDEYLADNPSQTNGPLVAASIGPYGAALADGSEYSGNYDVSDRQLREFHESRLALLDQSDADLFACETIPNYVEAVVLRDLLNAVQKPAWVSFSCRDESQISDGTSLRDACALFANHENVAAVGINCTAPGFVTALIGEARAGAPEKAIVVYPNSGETYHSDDNSWSGNDLNGENDFRVEKWLQAGASMIGGCCRTGPGEIAAIKKRLQEKQIAP